MTLTFRRLIGIQAVFALTFAFCLLFSRFDEHGTPHRTWSEALLVAAEASVLTWVVLGSLLAAMGLLAWAFGGGDD